MRIPKRVNTVLDRMEQHYLALGVVVALVVVALVAVLMPSSVGIPAAALILGVAAGGFAVHVRSSRRVARARAEVDNLLRENGALRHRNTVLASGVITREAQETQALVSIPEDDLIHQAADGETQSTVSLDELLDGDPQTTDELPDRLDEAEGADEAEGGEEGKAEAGKAGDGRGRDDDPQRTTVLPELPDGLFGEDDEDTAKNSRRA
ncbi:hypothetical protein [Actinomadura sp. 7K507]|uniref:hypothetical protein n=1 Tax=Actinomadura sp. 7K507 TaxID=2530365 RepID=UPI00104D4139|nr:hypothetical protein [Actinomadura sp. 7K507]TDC97305.1 hypothetical protein E1285_04250 [Actinomadura sp. 7K507]